MLSATVVALAWLCLARTLLAQIYQPRSLRAHTPTTHSPKVDHKSDLNYVLASIDERLRLLDTIGSMQVKQARRLDFIQERLDRVETTLTLKLDRAQLAAERLEHRLHMLEINIQSTNKDHTAKIEQSQTELTQLAKNLSNHIDTHTRLLEKVNGAYVDTWRRGLVLESLMRDGLSLVNVTRRELADGLRTLARRQRDARLNSGELEAAFTRRLNDNTYKIDLKMQEVLNAQKRFLDSCQRLQQDDPTNVADVLGKLIDSVINKTAATFQELQNIQVTLRSHDAKVTKVLHGGGGRMSQGESTCRRLESAFRNASQSTFQEKELQQLTEKFIALTNRADAALLRLEARLSSDDNEGESQSSDVTAAADRLFLKLKGIKAEEDKEIEDNDDWDDDEPGYFDDGGGGDDLAVEDRLLLNAVTRRKRMDTVTSLPPHRRHLHKHPYDRGPK